MLIHQKHDRNVKCATQKKILYHYKVLFFKSPLKDYVQGCQIRFYDDDVEEVEIGDPHNNCNNFVINNSKMYYIVHSVTYIIVSFIILSISSSFS